MARTSSSNRSFNSQTRDDIPDSLEGKLALSTVSVAADNFLRFANLQTLWDSPDWGKVVDKLTADDTLHRLKQSWDSIPNESDQYKPFCEWVERLIAFITQFPNQPTRQISFLPKDLSSTLDYADGGEGPDNLPVFSPDAVCVPKGVGGELGSFRWSQVLVPVKIKKQTSSSTPNGSPTLPALGPQTSDILSTLSISHNQSCSQRSRVSGDESATQGQKARTSIPYDTPSSGPVSPSYSPTRDDVQLSHYAMETLAAVGDRTHVFALMVKRPMVTLWYFDRCGAVCTSALDTDTSEGFLTFLKFLSALVYMGDDALGFNPFFTDSSTTIPAGMREGLDDLTVNIPNSNYASLRLLEELERRAGLVGRATLVWKAQLWENGGESGGTAADVVIKSSWQHSTRTPEWKILRELHKQDQARDHIVWCFHGWEQPGATGSSQRAKFGQPALPVFDDRALRHTVLEYLRPITKLSKPFHIPSIGWNVMQGMYDFVFRTVSDSYWWPKAIKFLNDMRWYHCDISIGNIGFSLHPDCGGVLIKLRDFDLSKHHDSNSRDRHWTGTLPFMSIALLENPKAEHKIGFEVEALMWTLLWIVRVYANGVDEHEVANHLLRTWFANGNDLRSIAAIKKYYLEGLDGFTNEFYHELEPDMADLATQWDDMRMVQVKERREDGFRSLLLSESLYGMPGFMAIEDWMTGKGWNRPREPCSCGEHYANFTS